MSTTTHPTGRTAKPIRTTDGRFTFNVLRQHGPVLVDFSAPALDLRD